MATDRLWNGFVSVTLAAAAVSLGAKWRPRRAGRRLQPVALRPFEQAQQHHQPRGYVAATLASLVTLELLPYAEELVRDWRTHPARLMPPAAGPSGGMVYSGGRSRSSADLQDGTDLFS